LKQNIYTLSKGFFNLVVIVGLLSNINACKSKSASEPAAAPILEVSPPPMVTASNLSDVKSHAESQKMRIEETLTNADLQDSDKQQLQSYITTLEKIISDIDASLGVEIVTGMTMSDLGEAEGQISIIESSISQIIASIIPTVPEVIEPGSVKDFLQKAYLKISGLTAVLPEDEDQLNALAVLRSDFALNATNKKKLIQELNNEMLRGPTDQVMAIRSSVESEIISAGSLGDKLGEFESKLFASKIMKSYYHINDDALYMLAKKDSSLSSSVRWAADTNLKSANYSNPVNLSTGTGKLVASIGTLFENYWFSALNTDLFPITPAFCDITGKDEQEQDDINFVCKSYYNLALGNSISEVDYNSLKSAYVNSLNRDKKQFISNLLSTGTTSLESNLGSQLRTLALKFVDSNNAKNAVNFTNVLISKYLRLPASSPGLIVSGTGTSATCGIPAKDANGNALSATDKIAPYEITYQEALDICNKQVRYFYDHGNVTTIEDRLKISAKLIADSRDYLDGNNSIFRPIFCQNLQLKQTHVTYGLCELFKVYVGRDMTFGERDALMSVVGAKNIVTVASFGIIASQKANFAEMGWRIAGGENQNVQYDGSQALARIKAIAKLDFVKSVKTGTEAVRKNQVIGKMVDALYERFLNGRTKADLEDTTQTQTYNVLEKNLYNQIKAKLKVKFLATDEAVIDSTAMDNADFQEILRLFIHGASDKSTTPATVIVPAKMILKYNDIKE
jgi:hypothetical protein